MDQLFLDANVLFAAAYKPNSGLRRLWDLPDTELWSSDYAVWEALANLSEDRPAQVPELRRLAGLLRLHTGPLEETGLPEEQRIPAKGRPILQAAYHVGATHLITNDRTRFGRLLGCRVGGILILRPSEYLRSRRSPTPGSQLEGGRG